MALYDVCRPVENRVSKVDWIVLYIYRRDIQLYVLYQLQIPEKGRYD